MADEEVATKAPESDAQGQSLVSGDTPAQQGASMGVCNALLPEHFFSAYHLNQEHCVTDRPTRELYVNFEPYYC